MLSFSFNMYRVGQSYICTVHIWYGWQGNHLTYGRLTYGHLTYGHLRCVHTVLANPKYTCHTLQLNGEYLLIVVKRVTVALAVCPKYIFI